MFSNFNTVEIVWKFFTKTDIHKFINYYLHLDLEMNSLRLFYKLKNMLDKTRKLASIQNSFNSTMFKHKTIVSLITIEYCFFKSRTNVFVTNDHLPTAIRQNQILTLVNLFCQHY